MSSFCLLTIALGYMGSVQRLHQIASTVLGCELRAVGLGVGQRIRLVTSEGEIFPTGEEAERAAKEQALARGAELEAELKRRG
jgi:hypothetical protein